MHFAHCICKIRMHLNFHLGPFPWIMECIFHYYTYATCKMHITLSLLIVSELPTMKIANSYIFCFTYCLQSLLDYAAKQRDHVWQFRTHTLQLDFVIMKTTDLINMKMWQTLLLSQQTMLKLYLPTNENGAVICNKRVIFTETLSQIRQTYTPCYFAKCSGTRVCSSLGYPLFMTESVQATGSSRGPYAICLTKKKTCSSIRLAGRSWRTAGGKDMWQSFWCHIQHVQVHMDLMRPDETWWDPMRPDET